ncbi:unnamed protein product [Mytilus coruscus]|uniref:Integrase zinc-binding domain-containing protein n=1 Tax=Mytilus coruscus TaxID=42192 RepID=A0A6J8ALW9_MYTCO|nr:unnamed protein product [Mytilus coruscus]
MLLRLQTYNYSVNYNPGKLMFVPDILSRAYIKDDRDNISDDIECFINMVIKSMPVSDKKMEEIRDETEKDDKLSIVRKYIREGWPENKYDVPNKINEYWNCKDELTEYKGIVLKGEKIVIPTSLRDEMMKRLHESHLGIEKNKKLATDFKYWPGINGQIDDTISNCGICLENRYSKQKEPMIPSEIPEIPWHTVGTDLFHWNGSDYLIVVDYYSRYFEIAKLENITEKYVNIAKSLLDKAIADEKDPYIALLDYRNTPINDVSSPAQLLMNRRLRGKLPATQKQLTQKTCKKQQKFSKGQTVRYQDNNRWKPAVITDQHDQPRSYTIQTPYGNTYRRNTKHIMKTNENFENVSLDDEIQYELPNEDTVIEKEKSDNSEQPYTTRSGITIRPPIIYKDYVN